MVCRTGPCLLAMVCWLIAGGAIHAASGQGASNSGKQPVSHIQLPPFPGASDVSPEAFQEQLNRLALEDLLQKAVNHPEKYLKPEDIEAAKKLNQKQNGKTPSLDPNDPKVQDLIKKLLEQYEGKKPEDLPPGAAKVSPEMLGALKKQAEKLQTPMTPGSGSGGANPGNGDTQPPNVPQPNEQSKPAENSDPNSSAQPLPPASQGDAGAPTPKTEAEKKDEEANKAFMKFIETFKESKSLSKAIESLQGGDDNGPDALGQMDEESGFDWLKFGEETGLDKVAQSMPKIDWKWPDAAKLPPLSGPNWETKKAPALPSASDGMSAGGSILAIFLTILLLIVLGLAAWKFRHWFTQDGDNGLGGSWRLGPWPVQPALVRTREELIRAFEYLSLLRLGRSAGTWNHRRIAAQLGVAKDAPVQGGEAAARLASLYEHARYAPATDELADAEFEAARRDLSLLAGVPGA